MTTTTEHLKPAETARAVDPAAELIRAALAWRDRTPSIGEAHANLMRAAESLPGGGGVPRRAGRQGEHQ